MDHLDNNSGEGQNNIGVKVILKESDNKKITFPENNGMVVLGDGGMPENKEEDSSVPSNFPPGVTLNADNRVEYTPNSGLNSIDFPETEGVTKIIVNSGAKVTCNGKVEANAVLVRGGGSFEISNPVGEEGNSNNGIENLFLEVGGTFKIGNTYIHGSSSQLFNELDSSYLAVVVGEAPHVEVAGDVPIESTGDVFA